MTEVKMHTTIYFKVPLGEDSNEYIKELMNLSKEELAQRITDIGDGEIELN
jgi:hypothetical protein